MSTACYMLGGVLIDQGEEVERALALYEECLSIARRHGLKIVESMTLAALGIVYALTGNTARAAELLPEALRMQREMNATMAIGWTLQYLGILAFQQGEYGRAGEQFLASLAMAPQGGANYIVPLSLEGVAGIAGVWRRPEAAARLLGAAEALREAIGLQRAPAERGLYERILAGVREQLPGDALLAGWQAGRALSAAEAIAEAEAVARDEEVSAGV